MNSCTALASCHYLHNQFEIEFFLQQDGEFLAKIKFACREVMNSIGLSLGIDSSLERNVKYYSEGYGNTGSEKPLNLAINGWLRGCLNNHKLCGKDRAPNFMPPRLLDLNEPTVRLLCDTSKLGEAPYVTLSHCWGTSAMSLKLTSGNMMSLSHGIEQLPQTFKDAIYIARKMGINYLWIDTLCIIQDDSTGDVSNVQHLIDWQKHVKIMDIIYQNCTINIAAASGSGPSSGCFVTREPASVAPCMVNLRKISRRAGGRWARDEISSPYVILGMNPNNVVDLVNSIGNFHLDSRGWVEQERLLSPRVLHFADRQIFWECSETPFACESTVLGTTPHNQHSLSHLPFFNDRPMFDWKAGEPGEQYERWLRILQAFTGRALTKPEDKLPAIAGIARRVQSILCDDYISGLFRSALPQALLWRRDMSAKVKPQLRAVYCSPTWSWAQFEGSINFKWCFYRFAPGRDFAIRDRHILTARKCRRCLWTSDGWTYQYAWSLYNVLTK